MPLYKHSQMEAVKKQIGRVREFAGAIDMIFMESYRKAGLVYPQKFYGDCVKKADGFLMHSRSAGDAVRNITEYADSLELLHSGLSK